METVLTVFSDDSWVGIRVSRIDLKLDSEFCWTPQSEEAKRRFQVYSCTGCGERQGAPSGNSLLLAAGMANPKMYWHILLASMLSVPCDSTKL